MNTMVIFSALEGKWNLKKNLFHFGKDQGLFEGVAYFNKTENKHCYLYREEGTLLIQGKKNSCYREYWYEYNNDKISVFFKDKQKKLFHTLKFDKDFKIARAHHLCVADNYDARYEFPSLQRFRLSYAIQGPSKNALYVSEFTKEELCTTFDPLSLLSEAGPQVLQV